MNRETLITHDRMRYSKNKFSANMALLAIVFNAIYFVSIYKGIQENVQNYYFNILMGVSVLVNLIFMLAAFLASEGIKNYKSGYAAVMFVIAAMQLVRIFGYPMGAYFTFHTVIQGKRIMELPQFILCVTMLLCSACCLVASATVGIVRNSTLKKHNELVEQNGGKLDFGQDEEITEENKNEENKSEKDKTEGVHVPLVDVTENTEVDASVLGEEPVKSEKTEE